MKKLALFYPNLIKRSISYEDCVKPWIIIASHGLPKVATSSLNLNRHPWINSLWKSLQDALSMFNSKIFMKHWSAHRCELLICINDNKFNLSILRACGVLKFSRNIPDSVSGLTNHFLETSRLGFDLSRECENPDDNVLSVTKKLMTKTFTRLGVGTSVPYLVL